MATNSKALTKETFHILVLVPNKSAAVMLRGTLGKAGYKDVTTSTDENDARELLSVQDRYHLVICDSDFGKDLNGRENVYKFYQSHLEGKGPLTVLMVPGDNKQKHAQANAIGIEDLMFHPVNAQTLVASVDKFLTRLSQIDPYKQGLEEANTMIEAKQFAEVLKELEIIKTLNPQPYEAYYTIGYVHMLRNELVEAENNFLQAMGIKPHHLKSLYGLAFIYLKTEQFDLLMDTYSEMLYCLSDPWNIVKKCIKLFPVLAKEETIEKMLAPLPGIINAPDADRKELAELFENNLACLFPTDNEKFIEKVFTQIKRIYGVSDRLFFLLAKIMIEKGKITFVEKYMGQVNDPEVRESEDFLMMQVKIYLLAKEYFKMIELARKAKAKFPNSIEAHSMIVLGFAELGDKGRAQSALDDLKKVNPPKELFDQYMKTIEELP